MPDSEEITPNINKSKLKRPKKHTLNSLYRDHPHTTLNGKGIVARIKKKKK